MGGLLPAIEAGFIQQEIADSAFIHSQELTRNERVIVGVNQYSDKTPLEIPILEMDPQGYEKQIARLNQLRLERDNDKVQETLTALRDACENDKNVMPYLIDCANAYVTLGETVAVMREVFGIYTEKAII
jgi:methylmalonyl-CoA mutase N-terminal domain/subunit